MFQLLYIIFNKSDASIKTKDVQTDANGQYIATDNISVLSVISTTLHKTLLGSSYPLEIIATIYYSKASPFITHRTIIQCYYISSYVDHTTLDTYLNTKNDDTKIFVYSNSIDEVINIRLLYIQNK